MIAFTVSSSPTVRVTQTNAMAKRRWSRRAIKATRASTAVAMSPYPIIVRKSAGTEASTAPGARIVPPTMRKAWIHTSGTNASSRGSLARRGTRYPPRQERVGGQAESELDSKENDRCHGASQIVSAWICLQVVTQAIFDGPPGLAFAHDLEDLLDLAVKRSIGLPRDAQLLHLLDVQVVVVTHLRRLLPWQS